MDCIDAANRPGAVPALTFYPGVVMMPAMLIHDDYRFWAGR
ncbi:MAG TPA: hypothetical protein VK034_28150 [Enhygromyxa sp.]|nr:hypothetical protein [Enhygromyxa sp.]